MSVETEQGQFNRVIEIPKFTDDVPPNRGFFRQMTIQDMSERIGHPCKLTAVHYETLPVGTLNTVRFMARSNLAITVSKGEMEVIVNDEYISTNTGDKVIVFKIGDEIQLTGIKPDLSYTPASAFDDVTYQLFELDGVQMQLENTSYGLINPYIEGLYYIQSDTNTTLPIDVISQISRAEFIPAQVNHSWSIPGVYRGLHAESWAKTIKVVSGRVLACLVDVRPESPSFRSVTMKHLDANSGWIYIPVGFANGFQVVPLENGEEVGADYVYVVNGSYKDRDTRRDQAINMFSPDLNIHWDSVREKIISQRDLNGVSVSQFLSSLK